MLSISNNYFSSLPNEVTEKILKKVEIKDFCTISRVSSVFANHVKNLLKSEVITKPIFTMDNAFIDIMLAGGAQANRLKRVVNAIFTQEKIKDIIRAFTFEELEGANQINLQTIEILKTVNIEKMHVQHINNLKAYMLKIRSDFNATPIGSSFTEKEKILHQTIITQMLIHLVSS